MSNGHWQWHEEIDSEAYFGFIYQITNLRTNRKYIGRKQFRSTTRKKIPGRKNRKHITTESKWRTYTGSNKTLNQHIKQYGAENFEFRILSLHKTKAMLSYTEAKMILKTDAVLRDDYYNMNIPPAPKYMRIES